MKLNPATHDANRGGVVQSAAILMPLIYEYADRPSGMLDVGAGEGHWMRAYKHLRDGSGTICGVDVEERKPGWEGSDENGWPWISQWDAENGDKLPLRAGPGDPPEQTAYTKWPLALCLEVAEHVTPDAGAWLVIELCRAADVIAFSAAIPGQGGDGHVNEQWPSYWSRLFRDQSYALIDPWRDAIWNDQRIEPWYRQNLLCAVPLRVGHSWPDPLAFVHPEIWKCYR